MTAEFVIPTRLPGMNEYTDACRRHAEAFPEAGDRTAGTSAPALPPLRDGGRYRHRSDGEKHLWSPKAVRCLHQAVPDRVTAEGASALWNPPLRGGSEVSGQNAALPDFEINRVDSRKRSIAFADAAQLQQRLRRLQVHEAKPMAQPPARRANASCGSDFQVGSRGCQSCDAIDDGCWSSISPGAHCTPCWRRWSRIRRRTTCDGVTSCDAHSASNAFFLEGSMSTVSRAVFCSRLRIRVGLNLHSNEHVIQRCIHRAWRPTQRRQA